MTGVITEFDEHVGLGTVRDDADGELYLFHCTHIAGGSRTIPVGARVTFTINGNRPLGPEAYGVVARTELS